MTKAIYKILAKTWPQKKTNKKRHKQWGATSRPNPSFVNSKCLVRTLGRPRSRVRRRRMQHPQGGSIGCWPQWVSPVNAAWAKLGRRCFQALIGLVWRRIHLWQNLNFLALRFFEPKLLHEKKCRACCHFFPRCLNAGCVLPRTSVLARLFKRGVFDSPT